MMPPLLVTAKCASWVFFVAIFIAAPAGAQLIQLDNDSDGMDDLWESEFGFDSTDPGDAWLDLDGDNVLNIFEFQLMSDPNDNASPVSIVWGSGDDLDDLVDALTEPTLIRVPSGTLEPDVFFFKGVGLVNKPINVMIQGGWNEDFTARDVEQNETVFINEAGGRMFDLFFSVDKSTVIVDGITFLDGIALDITTSDSAFATVSMHDVRVVGFEDNGSLIGGVNISARDESRINFNTVRTLLANNEGSVYLLPSSGGHIESNILHTVITDNLEKDIGSLATGFDVVAADSATANISVTNSIIWGNFLDVLGGDIRLINDVNMEASHSVIGQVVEFPFGNYVAGDNVLNEDPLFVDAMNTDYHLMPESNLMNAGKDVGLPFDGTAPEIGLFEVAETQTNTEGEAFLLTNIFDVAPSFPNPFSTRTSISLQLYRPAYVSIFVYDMLGREIHSFVESSRPEGPFIFSWDGKDNTGIDAPSGLYFIQVQAGSEMRTRRVVLSR